MLHARDLDGQPPPRTPHPPWVPVVGNALPPNAPVNADYLGIEVGSPVSKALTFLPWIQTVACAGAPPLAAVPKILLTEVLLCKTQLPPSAVDAAELRNTNLLTWRPKDDWLSRRITTMHNLGMFDESFNDEKIWLSYLRGFPIPPPQQTDFYITKNDLEELEPVIPAVLAPPPRPAPPLSARTRGGEAALPSGPDQVPIPPGPPPHPPMAATLKWLQIPIPDLVVDNELPFLHIVRLWSLLYDSSTAAARASPTSTSAVANESLRNFLSRRLHLESPSDASLAAELIRSVDEVVFFPLPELRTTTLTFDQVQGEMRDSITFLKGGRETDLITAKRLHLGTSTYPELAELARELPSTSNRIEVIQRIVATIEPTLVSSTLQLQLRPCFQLLQAKASLAATARAAGKTGLSLIDVLLADVIDVRAASHVATGQEGNSGPRDTAFRLSQEADRRVFDSPNFQVAADLIARADISTAEGRRKVLSIAAFANAAIFQLLFDRPTAHKGKHAALTKVHACLNELGSYIGIAQTIDEETGTISNDRAAWIPPQDQVQLWSNGKVSSSDYLGTESGALAILNLESVEPYLQVPDDQRFITPSCVEAEGKFGHRTLVCWGAPATTTSGYTYATLFEKHNENLKLVLELPSAMQAELLPHADRSMREARRQIDRNVRLFLDTPEPATTTLLHLLGYGEQYDRSWLQKFSALQPLLLVQRALPGLLPASRPRVMPGVKMSHYGVGGITSGSSSHHRPAPPPQRNPPHAQHSQGKLTSTSQAGKPGSKSSLGKWSQDKHYMQLGADRYHVKGICDELKLDQKTANALCWPVLLSTKPKPAALELCQHAGHPEHQGANAKAHCQPKGFDLHHIRSKYLTIKANGDGANAKKMAGKKRNK